MPISHDLRALLGHLDVAGSSEMRVGIDVESIGECGRLLGTRGGRAMYNSRFTPHERAYIDLDPTRFAARWAAKEAVAKAIGTGFRGVRPIDIEIEHARSGEPRARSYAGADWPLNSHEWQWSLSISHEGDAAVAIAIARVDTQGQGRGTANE